MNQSWGSKAAIIIGGTAILFLLGDSRFAPFVILSLVAVLAYWALSNPPQQDLPPSPTPL